jgi:hypothetical protein
MTVAHVAGLPVEEWLFPLVAASGGIAAVLRARFGRRVLHRRGPAR